MEDQRAVSALARIERAVARIEASAASRGAAANSEIDALRTAHGRLRGRVERAIAELDDLIVDGGEVTY